MTLKTRNRLQGASLTAATGLLTGAWVSVLITEGFTINNLFLTRLPLASAQVVALMFAIGIHRRFRKISAPEVFFVVTFLCTLAVEVIPPITSEVAALSGVSSTFISRTIYAFRWIGSFGLLVAGLYAVGVQYRQQEFIFLLIVLLAFFMAFYLPVNGGPGESGFASLGFRYEIMVFRYILLGAIGSNFLLAAFLHRDANYLVLALAMILVVFSREVILMGLVGWFGFLVPIVLAVGLLLASNRLYALYMWS